MKTSSRNIGVFMVALVAISVGATYALTSSTGLLGDDYSKQRTGTLMLGHIDAVVYDDAGQITAYRQSDNEIVLGGMHVLADQLFLTCDEVGSGTACLPASTNNHTNTTSGAFGWMNIGNSSVAVTAADTGLGCPIQRADNGGVGGCAGNLDSSDRINCVGVFDEVWNGNATQVGPGPNAQINVTVISTFDGLDCASQNIREAGMWNNATVSPGGELFARNTFGSVTLTTTDSLELTWRFTFTDQ